MPARTLSILPLPLQVSQAPVLQLLVAIACCNGLRGPVAAHVFAMFCFADADLLSLLHGS